MDLSALESISKAREESLDFWGLMLLLATALVVIGLVVEYWHDVQEFWVRLTWPMASFPWDKFTALAGGILVTIGVAGELLVTYKASRVETQLRENSHRIETFLTQQAGDAATSAKTAHEEADAVKLGADVIQKRLDKASAQLVDLERQTLIQGPRWRLLEANKDEFINALTPFAGQRLVWVRCSDKTPEGEPYKLQQDIFAFLGSAGWKIEAPVSAIWGECTNGATSMGGNLILFSDAANETVARAARALGNALMNSKIYTATTEAQAGHQEVFRQVLGAGSPWELAAQDPTTVVLLIGKNPLVAVPVPKKQSHK
jgi:hypothetical protein